jgi:hypothetical protein
MPKPSLRVAALAALFVAAMHLPSLVAAAVPCNPPDPSLNLLLHPR